MATSNTQADTTRSIMERLSFRKAWYVYIKANIFDVVVHTFSMKTGRSNATLMSLHGAVTQMDKLKISRGPCQSLNGSIFNNAILEKGSSQSNIFIMKSKICGQISMSSSFIGPQDDNDKYLTWVWQIYVNQHFIINVTLLSLESRLHPPCITRAVIEELDDIDVSQRRSLGVFCPNSPSRSFYSNGNHVVIDVHTSDIYEGFFPANVYFNQWIETVSFTYEILDNGLSFVSFDPWIHKDMPRGKDDYENFSLLTPALQLHRKLPSIHLAGYLKNKTSYIEKKPFLFQMFETEFGILYIFHFQSYLGATTAVTEGSLICTKGQGTLVAYEGPTVDITQVDSLLVRLQEWNCGHFLNATNHEAELKGRVGDMTILFLVENESTFFSLRLKVVVRAIETNPTFASVQTLVLETGGNSISFEQMGTYFYSIDIVSVKNGFVKIYFDNLSLRGYMDQSCKYGGIYIVNNYTSYTHYVEGMCSHKAATRFQHFYGRHGLTLNDRVRIYIKQYNLLFVARMKLRFSLDQCLGLFNLQMHTKPPGEYFLEKKRQVKLIRENQFYGHGSNFYYRWYKGPPFVGIERRSNASCFKLQYFNFDTIGTVNAMTEINKVIVGTGHVENVKPSRISMGFWAVHEELKYFDNCLAHAFRLFADNHNNEPYVLLRMPKEDSWITHAFTAKFALDMRCLIFGGAFHIHVQEANSYSQCFSEVGGYLSDVEHPIIPQGVCGSILVNLYQGKRSKYNRISFQRPLSYARCCHLNILIMSSSTPCIKSGYIYITRNWMESIFDTYSWQYQINSSDIFTWRALCTKNNNYGFETNFSFIKTCIDIFLLEWRTCDVRINYHMSLLPIVNNANVTESNSSQQMCRSSTCYSIPRNVSRMSWDDAQALCEEMNGGLVSVSSDAEWRQLTTHSIVQQAYMSTKLFYIGYRTVSNTFHNAHIMSLWDSLLF